MAEGEPSSRGLFSSLAGMFDTLLAAVQNRVELFAVELREEKCRFIEVLLWAASAIFLAVMAVTVLTFAIIYLSGLLFGEVARLWFLIGFALLYAGGAYGAGSALRRRLTRPPGPFAGTIAELKKDRDCLRPRK